MAKSALVVGACGFIARWLVKALVEEGWTVDGVDNLDTQVHYVNGSLVDFEEKKKGLRQFFFSTAGDIHQCPVDLSDYDAVFHLGSKVGVGQAEYEPGAYMSLNVVDAGYFAEHLVSQGFRGRLILASSMSVYGEGPLSPTGLVEWEDEKTMRMGEVPRPTRETDPPKPMGQYAISKLAQEMVLLQYGRATGVCVTALRLWNVYGPLQSLSNPYTGVAAMFAARLLRSKGGLIFEDGLQCRDFVNVSDVARAFVLAANADEEAVRGEVINIGTGKPTTLLDLHDVLCDQIMRGKLGDFVPHHVNYPPIITGHKRAGDIRYCVADASRAKRLLGWEAKIDLRTGLRRYADWLRTQDTSRIVSRVENEMQNLITRGLLKEGLV